MRRQTLFLLLWILPTLCSARIFKQEGPDGRISFGDTPGRVESIDDLPDVVPSAPGQEGQALHAALTVYFSETMVEFSYRFCRDKVPQTQNLVLDARNAWNTRHAAMRKKKIVVLHDHYSPDQLRKLAADSEQQQMSLLGKVGAASAADKDRWCAEAPARFDGETMSPMRKPSLVRALQSYKPLDR